MTCGVCRAQQNQGFWAGTCGGIEYVDTCPREWVPRLDRVNKPFWDLFCRMMPGLFDGFGGVQYEAIAQVMELYRVPDGQRPVIMDKVLVMVKIYREVKQAERKK